LDYSASLALILDGLSAKVQRSFFVFDPRLPHDREAATARASAVLLSRAMHTEPLQAMASECLAKALPYYIYVDDNFFVLADEIPELIWFKSDECARLFASAAGVASTSDRLLDYMRAHRFTQRTLRLTPVLPNWLRLSKPSADDSELRIAFCGAPFRSSDFKANIEPAIASLVDNGVRVSIIAREGTELPLLRERSVDIATPPWSISFAEFIRRWQQYRPNVVIHPKADTVNAPYKTPSIVIIAFLLGAVPVVAQEQAFEGMEQSGTRIIQYERGWRTALTELVSANARKSAYSELGRFCTSNFGPETNKIAIAEMLRPRG
jgi:hypothetical protein